MVFKKSSFPVAPQQLQLRHQHQPQHPFRPGGKVFAFAIQGAAGLVLAGAEEPKKCIS